MHTFNSIQDAHDALINKKITVTELVNQYLNVAKDKNSDIFAYVEIFDDADIAQQVEIAQAMIDGGVSEMLTGIPVAIKDNMLFNGHRVSASSKILENYVSTYDSHAVSELKKAGAIILGRTNMDEFAMGSSTETSAYGKTKNPLDINRVPGGSSGGSAAAVAMGGAMITLGSDTGGSIRQPAGYCGLVGFKPTYGTVSRNGLIAMASSFDQIGPLTNSVADAKILVETISTYDRLDAACIPVENRISTQTISTKKIGVPRAWVQGEGIEDSVKNNFNESLKKLESLGYELVDIELPMSQASLPVYYILMPAEVSSNLARLDGIRYGASVNANDLLGVYTETRGQKFGPEVRRRILLGTYILSHGYYDAYYRTALKIKEAITAELKKTFESVDFIVTPTTPFLAFPFGAKSDDPIAMKLSDLFLAPANISGIPAISIPSGNADNNLKHSIQFMGPNFSDYKLFELAEQFEKSLQ
jgi:aspartyl-tRNA(Asn)/glutamyl-tRNA(Gln) amidotransferase subunit A